MAIAQIKSLSSESSQKDLFFSVLQILGASLLLALCSQIKVPLYFSPVPLSGQTLGVMLIGATLGSRKGVLSVLAYLAEGSFGLPVFGSGSLGLLGPTGGYFLGFILQAYLVGWFTERQVSLQSTKTMTVLLSSCALQLGLGVLWLSFFVGFKLAMIMGLCPFLPGEVIKTMGVTAYLKARSNKACC
ncbi:MAG: biotin transporter BioY [Chlamydiales bacterium]|nr:biotin transporter BioY [Chlamydiales bacterium]